MTRKLLTVFATLIVAMATLPAMTAFAADANASLVSPANLFADGSVQSFRIDVRNDEAGTTGPLGLNPTPGASIHFMNVTIPTNMTDVACNLSAAAAGEFGCQVRVQRNGQSLIALESTGNGLAAGATLPIDFTAAIAAPQGVERTDTYEVRTAVDGNSFERATGALTQTVRGLQLGDVVKLDDLRTDAEVENRFTSEQLLRVEYDVTNRSSVAIDVTGAIAGAQNTPTAITLGRPGDLDPAAPTVPAGQTRTLIFQIDTTGVTNGFADYVPTASATGESFVNGVNTAKTGSAVRIDGNGNTNSQTDPTQYRAEAEALLAFGNDAASTVTVNGEDSRLVSSGPTTITIEADKTQIPRVYLDAHSAGTGSYAEFTVDCGAPTCPSVIGGLAAVDGDARELPRTGAAGKTVELTYQVDFGALPPLAAGTIYDVDVDFIFDGTDDNQFPFDETLSLDDLLQIDLDIPTLVIDSFTGNVMPNRVKDGDQATVTGYVQHTGDLESLSVQLNASTAGSDNTTYSQVVVTETTLGPEQDQGNGYIRQNFTGTAVLPGSANGPGDDPENPEATHALGLAGLLTASGSAFDTAGNQGPAAPRTLSVDNDHPDLAPVVPVTVSGVTENRALGFYLEGDTANGLNYGYGDDPVVRVTWNPGVFALDTVTGGCVPAHWDVDNASVIEVRYYNNTTCDAGSTPPAFDPLTAPPGSSVNDRVLVLDTELEITGLVNFSYSPSIGGGVAGLFAPGADPIRDDIRNEAYHQDGIVVDANTPPLPVISNVMRQDLAFGAGYEFAGTSLDTDAQGNEFSLVHTNTDDLVIPVTGGFIATSDQLQVVAITDTVNFDPNNDNPSTYTVLDIHDPDSDQEFLLDSAEIALQTCGQNCQARTPLAFRFLRTVQVGPTSFEIRFGDFTRADFLYDTQDLTAQSAALALDVTDEDDNVVGDIGTITFDGAGALTANDGNTVVGFYARADEWAVESVLGDGSSSTDYALHIGESVAHVGNAIEMVVSYDADAADFYGNSYFKLSSGGQLEDLAGNLMVDIYRVLPNGALELG